MRWTYSCPPKSAAAWATTNATKRATTRPTGTTHSQSARDRAPLGQGDALDARRVEGDVAGGEQGAAHDEPDEEAEGQAVPREVRARAPAPTTRRSRRRRRRGRRRRRARRARWRRCARPATTTLTRLVAAMVRPSRGSPRTAARGQDARPATSESSPLASVSAVVSTTTPSMTAMTVSHSAARSTEKRGEADAQHAAERPSSGSRGGASCARARRPRARSTPKSATPRSR